MFLSTKRTWHAICQIKTNGNRPSFLEELGNKGKCYNTPLLMPAVSPIIADGSIIILDISLGFVKECLTLVSDMSNKCLIYDKIVS